MILKNFKKFDGTQVKSKFYQTHISTTVKSRFRGIRCKPISSCKLSKLQSESLDQHPRGMGDWVILQSGPALGLLGNHTFANPPSHLPAPLPLDDDLMVHIEVFIVCTERLVCTWYVPINNGPFTAMLQNTCYRFDRAICIMLQTCNEAGGMKKWQNFPWNTWANVPNSEVQIT